MEFMSVNDSLENMRVLMGFQLHFLFIKTFTLFDMYLKTIHCMHTLIYWHWRRTVNTLHEWYRHQFQLEWACNPIAGGNLMKPNIRWWRRMKKKRILFVCDKHKSMLNDWKREWKYFAIIILRSQWNM